MLQMRNSYYIEGNTVVMQIFCKGEYYECLLSPESLPKLQTLDLKWYGKVHYGGAIYVSTTVTINGKRKEIRLHRFLTDAPEGMYVDHINHNPLDNRLENLNVVTNSENLQNVSGVRSDSKVGIRGVCFYAHNNKYSAYVTLNGKRIYGGVFITVEEAARKSEEMRMEHFPYLKTLKGESK